MAWTKSRARNVYVCAKKETTEGTDSAPTGGTDDLPTIDAPNPVEAQVDVVKYVPHSVSFTRRAGIPTTQFASVKTKFWLIGSANKGVAAVNGYAAEDAMLQAAGCKVACTTTTDLTYSPATVAQLDTPTATPALTASAAGCGPVTVWAALDGSLLHKANGVWGNIRMTGDPTSGIVCDFDGLGTYNAPTAATIANWTGGGLSPLPFRGVSLSITPSGGSAYTTGVLKRWAFDMGAKVEKISDANSSTGVKGILYGDRLPTAELVLGLDTTGTNLTYANIHSNLSTPTSHSVTWTMGTGTTGVKWTWAATQAQLTSLVKGVDGALRTLTIAYDLVNTTNESDWSLVVA